MGIVYTPVEVVDFIVHSVEKVLNREFGRSFTDENVNIIDPFTGTGTFITRLLQSGHIGKENLIRKYAKEIHANEIVLMAYYIASINIENVYHSIMADEEYKSFDGICLTDTFQLGEEASEENMFSEQFPTNSKRVIAQKKKPITVIISNPPYSVGQKSANDNAQNQSYPTLNRRLADTYVAATDSTNKNSLYDSYIKAFRWASDRINPKEGGIVGFVTNGAWIDGNAQEGFRKCLEREFSTIYVFNLRGNQRTSGELSRKEGGKIFGSGSRTPISITILVKHPNKPKDEKAKIYYHDIGDYLTREDKLRIVKNFGDISNPLMKWTEIAPNEHGDWISHRNEMFKLFTILGDKDDKKNKQTFFVPYYSSGLKTQRDAWCYNSSLPIVKEATKMQIDFYNEQRELLASGAAKDVVYSHKINWTAGALNDVLHNKHYTIDDCQYRTSLYRPFFKQHQLWYKPLNERQYQMPKLFPTPNHENILICVSGIGAGKGFSTLITDFIPCLDIVEKSQCFPLYWYDDSTADIADLFSQASDNEMDKYIRRDGITDWIRATARKQYGSKVDKEDIFYYVYGILHSPDYRSTFATDLKKSLPRLPLVESKDDFWAFSKAGRELAALHLNYETIEPYKGCIPEFGAYSNKGDAMNYRVEKMRFGKIDSKTADKSVIHYNSAITINNIPLEAYDYVVNGKSAIEWIMERYAVTTDTKSGITNDPNDWAKEHDDEKYIYNLLLRVINVSIQTVEIVKSLPKLKFEE